MTLLSIADLPRGFRYPPGTRDGWVYTIPEPPNGIDVYSALGPSSPFPAEMEVAVPGGVQPHQIASAYPVNTDGTLGPVITSPGFTGG